MLRGLRGDWTIQIWKVTADRESSKLLIETPCRSSCQVALVGFQEVEIDVIRVFGDGGGNLWGGGIGVDEEVEKARAKEEVNKSVSLVTLPAHIFPQKFLSPLPILFPNSSRFSYIGRYLKRIIGALKLR